MFLERRCLALRFCWLTIVVCLSKSGEGVRGSRWPNGLAFSCRERAADYLQKATDLAREAVNCNAVLGRMH
jgi:hypothetical protein